MHTMVSHSLAVFPLCMIVSYFILDNYSSIFPLIIINDIKLSQK